MATTSKTLVFVESRDAIESLLGNVPKTTNDKYTIIALTPQVEYELEKRSIFCKRPEDYFNEQEYEVIGEENTRRAEAVCSYLDDYLQREFELLRAHNIMAATFCLFYFKILFDAVCVPLYSVKTIVKKEQPDFVIFESTQKEPIKDKLYWIQESVYSRVIEFICCKEGIGYKCFSVQSNFANGKNPEKGVFFNVKKYARKVIDLWRGLGGWKAKLVFLAKMMNVQRKRSVCYLFLSVGENTKHIAYRMLSSSHYDVWIWQEDRLIHSLKEMIPSRKRDLLDNTSNLEQVDRLRQFLESAAGSVSELEAFGEFFRDDGLHWFGLVEDRVKYFIVEVVAETVRLYFQAVSLLNKIKPKALIFGSIAGYRHKAIAHAARQQKIPVITLHHGDVGTHYNQSYYYHDIVSADYYFTYGKGVESYLDRNYPGFVKSTVVGCPVLDQIQRRSISREALCAKFGLDEKKKIVIYVLTGLWNRGQYFCHNQPSDSSYYRINRKIVSVFESFDNIQLVVKGQRPSETNSQSPVEDYIRDSGKTNWKVINDYPFARLVGLADAFVIDAPATTLLQAMVTDTPIYIFNNSFLWEPGVLEVLQKRAYVYNDLNEFCDVLSCDLECGSIFEKRRTDDTFLRAFGIPSRDGKSVDRFLRAIEMSTFEDC